MESYYRLAPDISIIDMKDGNFVIKSDSLTLKLEGESAAFLIGQVFPLLDGKNELQFVCSKLSGVAADDLKANLDALVKAGVLKHSEKPSTQIKNAPAAFFNNFIKIAASDESAVFESLRKIKVGIAGLEAHGTQTVLALQQAGFVNFTLADPFGFTNDFARTFPFLTKAESRQESVQKYLLENKLCESVETGPQSLTRESTKEFFNDCQLIIVCFDKGFSSVFFWCNELSIEKGIPVLFASIKGRTCFIGPIVVPEKTSCYMCYKMRNVATEDDFAIAMAYEEHLNAQKEPNFENRIAFPGALNFTASVLSAEAIKYFLGFENLTLADRVIEFDTLSFESKFHNLIQKPDCPVCQKKNGRREHPALLTLLQNQQESDLSSLIPQLVSSHVGIIKKLALVPKDISEPKLPLVYAAELSNHSFLPKEHHSKLNCSGKGMDETSAQISAVGEAVERYSGICYLKDEVVYTRYNSIRKQALHPDKLVLYSKEQYEGLEYAPFDPEAELGWVEAHSLVNEAPILIPAQSAILNYALQNKQENICQTTSNGLAAGANLLNAILSAAEEVIERDAFMIAWHNQLPCKRVDPLTLPFEDALAFCESYRRRGVENLLYELPTDAPVHVFLGVALQRDGRGPTIVTGLGADFNAAAAARRALLEVGQVRPAFRQRMRMPETQERLKHLLENPDHVEDLEDHDLLYSVPDKLSAFDFLLQRPIEKYAWRQETLSSAEKMNRLIDFCKKENHDLIYFNLTPPDMSKMNLHTARVIISDFQPIHFGTKNIRLGGSRIFELPQKLGLRDRKLTISDLNFNPHPLA